MRCDLGDLLLHSYFDRELSAAPAAEFERHVLHCVDCAEELVALDFLRDRLQLAQLDEAAPASLRRKIRVDLGFGTATRSSQPLLWHWLAAAAALLFVAIVLWRVTPGLRNNDYQAELAEEIVDAHVRSLKPGQATGVASSDEHVVRGWFESTLKFAVPVRDFANEGFALRGGRVDAIEGRPFAALVYVRDGHLVNVFIWPTGEPDTSPRAGSRQGYQWIDWRKSKMEFCAVSNANPAELGRLYQLIAEQANSRIRPQGTYEWTAMAVPATLSSSAAANTALTRITSIAAEWRTLNRQLRVFVMSFYISRGIESTEVQSLRSERRFGAPQHESGVFETIRT